MKNLTGIISPCCLTGLLLCSLLCASCTTHNDSENTTNAPRSLINYRSIKNFFSFSSSAANESSDEADTGSELSDENEDTDTTATSATLPATGERLPRITHTPNATATALYRQGNQALAAGNYALALQFFARAHDADFLYLEPLLGMESAYDRSNQFEKLRELRGSLVDFLLGALYAESALEYDPPLLKPELKTLCNYDSLSSADKKEFDRKYGYIGDSIDYFKAVPVLYWSAGAWFGSIYKETGRQIDLRKRDFFYQRAITLTDTYLARYSEQGYDRKDFEPHLLYYKIQSYMGMDNNRKAVELCEYYKQHYRQDYIDNSIDSYFHQPALEKLQ